MACVYSSALNFMLINDFQWSLRLWRLLSTSSRQPDTSGYKLIGQTLLFWREKVDWSICYELCYDACFTYVQSSCDESRLQHVILCGANLVSILRRWVHPCIQSHRPVLSTPNFDPSNLLCRIEIGGINLGKWPRSEFLVLHPWVHIIPRYPRARSECSVITWVFMGYCCVHAASCTHSMKRLRWINLNFFHVILHSFSPILLLACRLGLYLFKIIQNYSESTQKLLKVTCSKSGYTSSKLEKSYFFSRPLFDWHADRGTD